MTGQAAAYTNRPELVAVHGYDTKYAMHALRLGLQGVELLSSGKITFPVPEPDRELPGFLVGARLTAGRAGAQPRCQGGGVVSPSAVAA
jgi:hypothetical protein